jgi:hypothetical protein
MNTCLSSIYLKLNQIDVRFIRIALLTVVLLTTGGSLMGIPMPGDVGG